MYGKCTCKCVGICICIVIMYWVYVKFVFVRFACACKLGGGTGGCMVKLDQDLNTVCESSGCSSCGVGIELWGPDGEEIIDFISPF